MPEQSLAGAEDDPNSVPKGSWQMRATVLERFEPFSMPRKSGSPTLVSPMNTEGGLLTEATIVNETEWNDA